MIATPDSPPPARRLALDGDRPLREGLVASFRALEAYALEQADRASTEPAVAVHEFRKTVRRLRSLVQMLRLELGSDVHRALVGALKGAVRRTSGLRDLRILQAALAGAADKPGLAEPRAELERRWHETLAELETSGAEREAVEAGRVELAGLSDLFERALDAPLEAVDLQPAIRRCYRRARKARRAAVRTGRWVHAHDWRKRTKELRYQLELLTSLPAAGLESLHQELVDLAQALGDVTDLHVLARRVRAEHREQPMPRAGKLRKRIERHAERGLATLIERSEGLFARGSRAFSGAVLAALAEAGAGTVAIEGGPAAGAVDPAADGPGVDSPGTTPSGEGGDGGPAPTTELPVRGYGERQIHPAPGLDWHQA